MSEVKYIIKIKNKDAEYYVSPGKIYKENGKKVMPLTSEIKKARLFDTLYGASERCKAEVCNMTGDINILTVDYLTLNVIAIATPEITGNDIKAMKEAECADKIFKIQKILNEHRYPPSSACEAIKLIRNIVK